jgi:16S rRNA U516 pseudouridylate synthase RsuA-like enzyme
MFGALKDVATGSALKVLELKRIRIGPVRLGLESGQWALLSEDDVRALLAAVGWKG